MLVALLMAAVSALWMSPELALRSVKAITSKLTPYELKLSKPSLQWSPLQFRADLLLVNFRNQQGPPLLSIQGVDLAMAFNELIRGEITQGHFTASNVTYYLDEESTGEPIDVETLLAPLARLPQEMDLQSVHIISRSSNLWIFPLHNVRAQRNSQGSMDIDADANIGERSVQLRSQADWQAINGAHRLELSATLSSLQDDSELAARGYINTAGTDVNYTLTVEGKYRRVSDFLRAFATDAYPFAGNLTVHGTLEGDLKSYSLILDTIGLREDNAYEFSAEGVVAQEGSGPVTLDLRAQGFTKEVQSFLPMEGKLAELLTRSELEMDIGGTLIAPELRRSALVLYGRGDTRLSLTSQAQTVNLSELQALSSEQAMHADVAGKIGSIGSLLTAAGIVTPEAVAKAGLSDSSATFAGEIHGTMDDLKLDLDDLQVAHPQLALQGKTQFLWHENTLSAPEIDVSVQAQNDAGQLHANGAIADVATTRGVAISVDLLNLQSQSTLEDLGVPSAFTSAKVSGSGLLLKAADTLRVADLDLSIEALPGINFTLTGDASLGQQTSADLALQLPEVSADSYRAISPFLTPPRLLEAKLRLRPAYFTVLSELDIGQTHLQGVATGDLDGQTVEHLSLDLYAKELHIDDFMPRTEPTKTEQAANAADIETLTGGLPPFPTTLTFRAGEVVGPLTQLETFTLALDSESGRVTLRELDTRYAGGELILRGNIDSNVTPPAISLAGRGIRVPLGALTEDLGLQQSVSGSLSFQGGLLTRGVSSDEWDQNLQGRIATALDDVTVSGAAYDLLMSNILAWVVKGASEKTTTFNCTMAQFDIAGGVAKSDSVYIETPRMLATGKASIDLPQSTLDVRIEPRSKSRGFQFPSAVRLQGDLADPKISISALQAGADLSAQALLLLPSLTLKLFGLGGADNAARPCETGNS